jgi:3-phenylpropionate/trans-cinnamate dioxygenase ferredoxin reductase subunit
MEDARTFVIVGAGQAGRWLALTLRADGFRGRIVWFGDEAHTPYDRPPLSKAVLQGEVAMAQLALLPEPKFAELATEWRAGERVVAIDRERRVVRSSAGAEVGYDALFLATGGSARTLPNLAPHPRVAYLRTYEDALAIKSLLGRSGSVLVIGGGWIGLEVAASARKLGKRVGVLEMAPRLCIRTVPGCVSEHLRELHESNDTELRLGDAVREVTPSADGVEVRLASGASLHADMLVAGLGLVPNDALAAECGLATGNGVATDASGRTSDASIYAVGDVANALRANGERIRLESWENAERQARAAAKAALAIEHDPDADGPPWFWSDQYDHNLQLLGIPDERLRVVERRVPAKRQRIFFFCDERRVRALAAVNAGREIKIARKWIREGRYPALDALADASVDLNKLPLAAA